MIFEVMGAICNMGKFSVEDIKEFFLSIPEFIYGVNSYLPENRFIRIVIYGTGVIGIIQLTPYVLRHTETFDYYYRHMEYIHRCCPQIVDQKKELFSKLKQDMEDLPRDDGRFRVLELHAGGGSNLTYYPENTFLVATDCNEKYEAQLLQNFGGDDGCEPLIGNVTLEKYIITNPEELKGVADNSLSAVVSIHSMCLPLDLNRAFDEIKRVLMPNGRLYFIEHVKAEGWNWSQLRFFPAFAMIGCHVGRRTHNYLKQAGFSEIKYEHFMVDFSKIHNKPIEAISPHIYGYAVK